MFAILRSALTWATFLGVAMISVPLNADDFIPTTLPKEKQENLRRFLEERTKKGAFVHKGAKEVWLLDTKFGFPNETDKLEQADLAKITFPKAREPIRGLEQATVYWYIANPKERLPGVTVKQVVDLGIGKQLGETEILYGYPSPMTARERAEAIALAKESVPALKKMLESKEKDVILEVLFQTIMVEKSPNGRPGDRVVSLNVRQRGVKAAADVNVTQKTVRVP